MALITHEFSFYSLTIASSSVMTPWPQPQRACHSTTPESFRHSPSHRHHARRPTISLMQPGPMMGGSILSSSPGFHDPLSFWHPSPHLEITPTATTSSSASAPGSQKIDQGRYKATENSPITNLGFMPVNNSSRTMELPEHPFCHSLLVLF